MRKGKFSCGAVRSKENLRVKAGNKVAREQVGRRRMKEARRESREEAIPHEEGEPWLRYELLQQSREEAIEMVDPTETVDPTFIGSAAGMQTGCLTGRLTSLRDCRDGEGRRSRFALLAVVMVVSALHILLALLDSEGR